MRNTKPKFSFATLNVMSKRDEIGADEEFMLRVKTLAELALESIATRNQRALFHVSDQFDQLAGELYDLGIENERKVLMS